MTGRWWLRLAAAGLLLTGAAGLVACSVDDEGGGDADSTPALTAAATAAPTQEVSPEEEAVQQVFLEAIAAWNANDVEAFATYFTDEAFTRSFTDEGLVTLFVDEGQPVGSQELGHPTFLDTNVSGETATMDNTFSLGSALLHSTFGLVQVEGDWKMASDESELPVDVPEGMTPIEVDLNEFAFGVDTSAIVDATGEFAIKGTNIGDQPHMLAIMRVPAGAKMEELLWAGPAGFEFIATTGDVEPGRSGNIVFVAPLQAGNYSMVCFLFDSDGDGPPHIVQGMFKEFTVD